MLKSQLLCLLGFDFGVGITAGCEMQHTCAAGMTDALLSHGTTQLLADRTMASAIGNASRRAIAAGMCLMPLMCTLPCLMFLFVFLLELC